MQRPWPSSRYLSGSPRLLGRQRPLHTTKLGPRQTAPGSEAVLVTHPFHPLFGQRLSVEGEERPNGRLRFRCTGPSGTTVVVPAEWTEHSGAKPGAARLTYEALAELATVVKAIEHARSVNA